MDFKDTRKSIRASKQLVKQFKMTAVHNEVTVNMMYSEGIEYGLKNLDKLARFFERGGIGVVFTKDEITPVKITKESHENLLALQAKLQEATSKQISVRNTLELTTYLFVKSSPKFEKDFID